MPRKKKIESLPLETFSYEGIDFEVRDESSWELGRGQASALEHYIARVKPIYENINETLFKSKGSNELRKNGIAEVKRIFETASSFSHQLAIWGIINSEGMDDTNARKLWYPKIKHHVMSAINAFEAKK
jgi:hypothetical protein